MRIFPGSASIYADAGNEVVDPAAQRVNRDKLRLRPMNAIGSSGHHQVIFLHPRRGRQQIGIFSTGCGVTVFLELAINPHQVDFTRAVNLRRWQHVPIYFGDERGFTPTLTAVDGNEGEEIHCPITGNWHNDCTSWLHKWLSTQAIRLISSCLGLAPGAPAIS